MAVVKIKDKGEKNMEMSDIEGIIKIVSGSRRALEDCNRPCPEAVKIEWEGGIVMCVFPNIKRVIFHDPATIVMWEDGTKTVVKANNEPFDKEKGLAMAICKKAYGNKGSFNEIFKKYCHDGD